MTPGIQQSNSTWTCVLANGPRPHHAPAVHHLQKTALSQITSSLLCISIDHLEIHLEGNACRKAPVPYGSARKWVGRIKATTRKIELKFEAPVSSKATYVHIYRNIVINHMYVFCLIGSSFMLAWNYCSQYSGALEKSLGISTGLRFGT